MTMPRVLGWGAGAVLLAGLTFRLYLLSEPQLWMDEMYGAVFADTALPDMLRAVFRMDVHPPLYYLQLWLWARAGTSDTWLLLNSLAWNVAAVVSTGVVAARMFGRREGVAAACLLAVMPHMVAHAEQLRMYSMLATLVVWAAYCEWRGRAGVAVLVELAIAYTHGLGFFMAFFIVGYGVLLHRRIAWQHLALAVAVLPAVANAAIRSAQHAVAPSPEVIVDTIGAQLAAGLLGCALLAAALALSWRRAGPLLVIVLGPFVVAGLVSLALRPMWQDRIFLFVLPFVAILGGIAVVRCLEGGRAMQGAAVLAFCAIAGAAVLQDARKPQDYRAFIEAARAQARAGDAVQLTHIAQAWAVRRYWPGAPQFALIDVQLEDKDGRWTAMLNKVPPGLRALVGLDPATRVVKVDGVTFCLAACEASGRVLRVSSAKEASPDRVIATGGLALSR